MDAGSGIVYSQSTMFDDSNIKACIHHRTPSSRRALFAGLAGALGAAPVALAQERGSPPDKSGFHLFNPTPRALMRDMSTDRPDTTESAYTVDAGHFQIEMSFLDFNHDRNNEEGETRRTLTVAPMLLKVGLLNNVDVQLGLAPYTFDRTTHRASGVGGAVDGFVDTVVRLKVNLWGNDDGDTALAVMPYITFPTAADGLGASGVEGGIILPFAAALPGGFALGAMVQLDFAKSSDDSRYTADLVHTVTLGHALVGDLSGYIEYAGLANLSHEEKYRAYFDAGLTYGLSPDIQLDAGVRVGLTEATDDLGVFAGISLRF